MKKRKRKVKPLEVYLGNLERRIKKGLADQPVQLNDSDVQVGYEILYSRHSQRCYYYVRALPQYLVEGFYTSVRDQMHLLKTEYPVYIHFQIQGVPHFINWESAEMKQRQKTWANYERSRDVKDLRFADAKTREISDFEDWRLKSWEYIQGAEDRKVQLIDCEVIFELSVAGNTAGHRRSLLDICKEFEQYCAKQQIKIRKVRNSLPDFLQYASMTSLNKKTKASRQVMNRVLSSEILADLTSYVPGKISDTGVLFGIDITTGMAVYKNMIRSGGEAENFLVIAETGGGKSYYMKALCLQMMLNGFHQVVLDIDGEYMPFARESGGTIINMSKSAGLYFDSTVIGTPTGDGDLDRSLLYDSQTTTANIFNILCDVVNGMTSTELRLFNYAYKKMYDRYGIVREDMSTWKNSANLSFFRLYEEIVALQKDPIIQDYSAELRDYIDKLSIYFDKDGIRAYMFQKAISLSEILAERKETPMFIDIVLNLESNQGGKQDVESMIKQATATYLVTLVTNYFKSMHEFSVHYIEEYQRYSSSPGVESLVVYMITGNRKRNAATFVISNSPTALLKMGGAANQAIVDNITNLLIGKVKESVVMDICKNFSLENCADDLKAIGKEELYKNAFILKINNKDTTIVRQCLPKDITEGPIFKTRDTKKKEDS